MQLPLEDVDLFFRLHRSLMFFVNQRLDVIDEKVVTPHAYSALPPTLRIKVHKALLEHMDLIEAFADENPFGFDETDLEIVRSWKHFVAGTFYAYRQLQKTGGGSTASAAMRPAHEKIVNLTDAFCREHLDAEYRDLCRKLVGVLSRKRPSPLTRGKPESWASGILRVVGWVNFLGDPSQPHHMKMTDIDERMGVSEATGSAKSKAIRDLLKIHPLDPEWTLPGRMEQNPIAWMIQVNNLILDARHLPREVQEEAFRKGLIPYIPADQTNQSADE